MPFVSFQLHEIFFFHFTDRLFFCNCTAKVSSSYSIRSTRGGYATILLTVGCLFFIWIQFAEYLGGIEEHQFTVDKDVGRDMQINVDMTVAIHCDKISVNVLDKSMDRLIVSELLKFQKVSRTWSTKLINFSYVDSTNMTI